MTRRAFLTPPPLSFVGQVDSVKVWQKNPHFFIDPAARVSIISTAKQTDTDGGAAGAPVDDDRDSSALLMYLGCALFGGFVGALCVAFKVSEHGSERWSKVYEAINDGRGPG